MDSNYQSTTNQAGIYAGTGGFDITVGKNTDLKGAVIASTAVADKNRLDTGTLTYSDIQNKADYSAGGIGISFNTNKNAKYNEKGITPDLTMPAKGNASGTTKAAIAPGTIIIRDNPKQDISTLSRDTAAAMNKLGQIFDKKKIEEQQEMAKVFGEEANKAIHIISDKNHWDDGSAQKIALHAAVAGITAQMTGNSFASGAVAGGVNEAAIKKIMDKVGKDNPDVAQAVSAVLGYAANKAIGKDGNVGATVAWHGTKWNNMWNPDLEEGEYETQSKAENEMDYLLNEEMKKTDFMSESLDSNRIKVLSDFISYELENHGELTLATEFYQYGLHGNGDWRDFDSDSLVSERITKCQSFYQEMKSLAVSVQNNETRSFYTSIAIKKDVDGYDNHLAFGTVKLAVTLSRDDNGIVSISGTAADLYNFEYKDGSDLITLINNKAFELQKAGEIKPYIWHAKIDAKFSDI